MAVTSDAPVRLVVSVDRAAADTQALVELKALTARGFVELKALIASGAPVLDIEMFTNDWYDRGAALVLAMLTDWEARGVAFTLREVLAEPTDDPAAEQCASTIALGTLRNIISAGQEERARLEALDERTC